MGYESSNHVTDELSGVYGRNEKHREVTVEEAREMCVSLREILKRIKHGVQEKIVALTPEEAAIFKNIDDIAYTDVNEFKYKKALD